jgi:tripartite-type tricarboxylate transporter receptor subunit TctC
MNARLRTLLSRIAAVLAAGVLTLWALEGAPRAQWKPERPVTIIVPWVSGSPIDLVTRVLAAEMEAGLGAKVVILNQAGASGATGTKSAIESPADGYTWAAGAANDLATYKARGLVDTKIEDWNLYLAVANAALVSVNAATPYKDFAELLNAFKANPGKIRVATAGKDSAGYLAIEAIRKQAPFDYKLATYDGANAAVVSTVGGEAEVVVQLAVEQADMLRSRRLRALAVLSDQPLAIDRYGEVPPLSKWIPNFTYPANYIGVWLHKGAPAEVTETFNKVWQETIAKSEKLKKYAASRGAFFTPYFGEDALKRVVP